VEVAARPVYRNAIAQRCGHFHDVPASSFNPEASD
jgi:hypothetical protein